MNKFILFLLFILLVHFKSHGQITFSKLYGNIDPSTTWGRSVEQEGSNYYIFGAGQTNFDGEGLISSFLLKTDSLGNQIIFGNFFAENTSWYLSNPGTLKWIASDRFVAGSTFNDNSNYGILYFFNSDCDTLFTKKFIGDGYTSFYNTDFRNDTIYLIGATRDTILYNTYMYLLAVDTLGNTLWERKYGNGTVDELGLIVDHFANGKLIIGGALEHVGAGTSTDGKIYKTNLDGDSYFSKLYGTPGDDGPMYIKVADDDQSFIIQQNLDTVINEGDYQYVRYIGKMDTIGNYIWRTFFNRPEYMDFWNFRENVDGTIVGCGVAITDSIEEFHGYITKLDAEGNILWERDYTTDNYYDAYFFDVQQTWDKGYIISGSAVGDIDGDPNQQMWLVKLDSMGCLEPGCADTGTAIIPFQPQAAIFTIYPNPISDIATVEIHIPSDFNIIPGERLQLNIYDINGRLVDHNSNIPVNNPNEIIRFNIYKKNLATGLYDAQLKYGNKYLGDFKIVVDKIY